MSVPVLAILVLCCLAFKAQAVELLINAHIYSMDRALPEAQAMATSDGQILAVGSDAGLHELYPGAKAWDLGGRTVIPGLIDAHGHLMALGERRLQADLVGTASVNDIVQRLKTFAAHLPDGAWLIGRGWDQNDWPGEHAFPSAAQLDMVFPDRPVWLERIDGHAGWANSAAMATIGNLDTLPDPEGGRIVRDSQGRATGIFVDNARELIERARPPLSGADLDRALHTALAELNSYGMTGVHDAGIDLETWRRYRRFADAGELPLRIYAMALEGTKLEGQLCNQGLVLGYDDRLWARSVKIYIDGALGSRGAALLADYNDDPGNRGLLRMAPPVFERKVERALGCGLQVNTHAIGDRGNRVVIEAYRDAFAAAGQASGRNRIEHAQILNPADIPRLAQLGIIASMQPTHATSDMYWAADRLGEERLAGAYAWQSLRKAGARLALGSDFPVESANPMLGIYAAVTRQDLKGWPKGGWRPAERLTREEALRGFTLDAAYAGFMEQVTGSLTPGKFADFAVLDQDPMRVPAADIPKTRVLATFLGGKPVYVAEGFAVPEFN